MQLYQKILLRLRLFYKYHLRESQMLPCVMDPKQASDIIYDRLVADAPCMITRFGGTEMKCLMNYRSIKHHRWQVLDMLRCKTHAWWWTDEVVADMQNLSGLFPSTPDTLSRFAELLQSDIPDIDVLGCWLDDEVLLRDQLIQKDRVLLTYLEPYFATPSWGRALAGKKVLVVHPFANTIKHQYETRRQHLFVDPNVLPDFQLSVLPAVQSLGGENAQGFKDWFEALEWMKHEIDRQDYDICIIGCGAYGMPLAAHVKRMGKKAIHLAGATQMMFGIKGKRWEEHPEFGVEKWGMPYGFYPALFNEYWVRPGNEGRPQNANQVEEGCYW